MIREGQFVLFRFPHSDQTAGKLRPALVLHKLPGHQDDWLVCMISSQLSQQIREFDEVINERDSDFASSGLKSASVIRISRIAVVHQSIFVGSIGEINAKRLARIRERLSAWFRNT